MEATPTQPVTSVILYLKEPLPTTKEQRKRLLLNIKALLLSRLRLDSVFSLVLPLSPAKNNTLGLFLITLSFCCRIQWSAW